MRCTRTGSAVHLPSFHHDGQQRHSLGHRTGQVETVLHFPAGNEQVFAEECQSRAQSIRHAECQRSQRTAFNWPEKVYSFHSHYYYSEKLLFRKIIILLSLSIKKVKSLNYYYYYSETLFFYYFYYYYFYYLEKLFFYYFYYYYYSEQLLYYYYC